MKTIVDQQDERSALASWRGATAKIWLFDVSLKRLGIRLWRNNDPDVLYVIGISCEHMCGPFTWKNADIAIEKVTDGSSDIITRIVDKRAAFELNCSGGYTIVRGPASDLDKSFENFLD